MRKAVEEEESVVLEKYLWSVSAVDCAAGGIMAAFLQKNCLKLVILSVLYLNVSLGE